MEDLGTPTYDSYHNPEPSRLLIVDVDDILQQLHQAILARGEKPAYDTLNNRNLESFLLEIYHEIGYLPDGRYSVAKNIVDVLNTSEQFFDYPMSGFQKQLWIDAAQQIIYRLASYKLYDPTDQTHIYDFYTYGAGTLYLAKA